MMSGPPTRRSSSGEAAVAAAAEGPPPDPEMGITTGSLPRPTSASARPSSASAPASASSAMAPIIATGEINEYTMYQRFRLKMVKMFGSMPSALYEFGMDAETGQISRAAFEEVVSSHLGLLSPTEASLLFGHVTNADPMEMGLGGFASYKDFSITEEEWRRLVGHKEQQSGQFQSGPRGGSMGIYHRKIKIGNIRENKDGGVDAETGTPNSSPMRTTGMSLLAEEAEEAAPSSGNKEGSDDRCNVDVDVTTPAGKKRLKCLSSRKSRLERDKDGRFPWRQKQKPWAPSLFAGPPMERVPDLLGRGRPNEQTFATGLSPKAAKALDRPRYGLLGPSTRNQFSCYGTEAPPLRGAPARTELPLAATCPTRRCEMEPALCASQPDRWWPYGGQPTRTRLQFPSPAVAAAKTACRQSQP